MKPFEQQSYYELLEIPVTASDADIRSAYERAMETYAPDSIAVYALEDPSQLDALRARLTEAMEMLTEPDLRIEYDRTIGLAAKPPPPPAEREGEGVRDLPDSPQLSLTDLLARADSEPAGRARRTPPEPPPPNGVPQAAAKPQEAAPPPSLPVKSLEPARPKPLEIPPDAEFNGELLRRVRESRNLTLASVADRTRISARHLENVEADRYDALPTAVYLRGILTNLARELGLDPVRVARSYLQLASQKTGR